MLKMTLIISPLPRAHLLGAPHVLLPLDEPHGVGGLVVGRRLHLPPPRIEQVEVLVLVLEGGLVVDCLEVIVSTSYLLIQGCLCNYSDTRGTSWG